MKSLILNTDYHSFLHTFYERNEDWRINFVTSVTEERKDGGFANYLQKIASEFVRRNHRVTVLLLSDRIETGEMKIFKSSKFAAPGRQRFRDGCATNWNGLCQQSLYQDPQNESKKHSGDTIEMLPSMLFKLAVMVLRSSAKKQELCMLFQRHCDSSGKS
jgi:hypothetical protein